MNASSFNGKIWAASKPHHSSRLSCLVLGAFCSLWRLKSFASLHSKIDPKLHCFVVLVFDIVHDEPGLSAGVQGSSSSQVYDSSRCHLGSKSTTESEIRVKG